MNYNEISNLENGITLFTWDDIKKNNYVVKDGYVYDISDFVNDHPGGALIKRAFGKDIEVVWKDMGYSWHINRPNVQKQFTEKRKKGRLMTEDEINKKSIELKYDVVIIGGGPSGIMTAYRLNEQDSDLKIVILEKNDKTLENYKGKGYLDISNWLNASYDMDYRNVIISKDEKAIAVGSGLGGGTLHFGLQYIDQIDILSKSNTEFQTDEYNRILTDISNIIQARRYDYSDPFFPEPLKKLKKQLESSDDFLIKNNKIYSKDMYNRILLGDLIHKNPQIDILYKNEVNKINFNGNNPIGLIMKNGHKYNIKKNSKLVLCAGAIYTPIILQRSGIGTKNILEKSNIAQIKGGDLPVGEKLYDHIGSTVQYMTNNAWKMSVNQSTDKMVKEVEDEINKRIMINTDNLEQFGSNLRIKPINDAEIIKQFGIYEEYLKTVVTARENLLELWENINNRFSDSNKKKMNTKIKNIDKDPWINYQINFNSENWFVYEMIMQARNNRKNIFNLISEIETMLDYKRFPQEWGTPPKLQTKDYIKLPCDFGYGSGTLAHWVIENVKMYGIPTNQITQENGSSNNMINESIEINRFNGVPSKSCIRNFKTTTALENFNTHFLNTNLSCKRILTEIFHINIIQILKTNSENHEFISMNGEKTQVIHHANVIKLVSNVLNIIKGMDNNEYDIFVKKYVKQENIENEINGKKIKIFENIPNYYIGHIQTRALNNDWQTYFSLIPGEKNKIMPILVVTHAQAGNLTGKGKVYLDKNDEICVELNHFDKDRNIDMIYDAFMKNHNILMKDFKCTNREVSNWLMMGNDGIEKIKEYLTLNLQTIYHYHGSCPMNSVTDLNQQLKGFENIYIGDLSVATQCIAGSTSVSAMLYGYRVAEKIFLQIMKNKESQQQKISFMMNEMMKKNTDFNISDIVRISYKQKMVEDYIKLQKSYISLEDILSYKTMRVNQSKSIQIEKNIIKKILIDNKFNAFSMDENVKINIEDTKITILANDKWVGKSDIYIWEEDMDILEIKKSYNSDIKISNKQNNKIKTKKVMDFDRSAKRIITSKKNVRRCIKCEQNKQSTKYRFRSVNINKKNANLSNIVKSIITKEKMHTNNIKFYLKEDKGRRLGQWDNQVDAKWTDNEKLLINTAIEQYEHVCNVNLHETFDEDNANIIIWKKYLSPQGEQVAGDTTMGYSNYAVVRIYSGAYVSNNMKTVIENYPTGGFVGGWDYVTILHELGHAFGLGHPHDTWGGSEIMDNVNHFLKNAMDELPDDFIGNLKANQFPYTIMSYYDIESKHTYNHFWNGFVKTMGPIDILALQSMYGVPEKRNESDTVYNLQTIKAKLEIEETVMDENNNVIDVKQIFIPEKQKEVSYWESIYDSGGIDTISAENSNENVIINLRSSILKDIENAGIFLSQHYGENSIKGGFTIPKGVIIENIVSGKGDDILYENEYANEIDGNDGHDTVYLLGIKESYLIIRENENTIKAINVDNNNEKNILKNIEKIVFNIRDEENTNIIKHVQYPRNGKGFKITIMEKT